MVSFSCESCCDVFVKKKLDQHANRCRGAQFTCLDCSTTFEGTSYRQHTSCISEAQKYQKGLCRAEKGKGRDNGPNGLQGGKNQRSGFGNGNGNGNGANPNLTPLGEREKEVGVEVEVKKVEEKKMVEEVIIREKEREDKKRKRKDEDAEKQEEEDKKAMKSKKEKREKREKKDKKKKDENKKDKTEEMEKEATNGAVVLEETLAQKLLDVISSKKETSISKVIKKLDKKGTEEEVWELLKQAKVRKEEGGKVVLVFP
ncbi:hypothetical protein EV426DRAFT_5483 [Tirmania nivea]|nr:hypothetical protein EV426DRAFT_5483 [Tirmania nivea]